MEAEINAAWQKEDEVRRSPCVESHYINLRKVVKMTDKNIPMARKTAMLIFVWALVRKLETRVRDVDQTGL